jgi:hypothetical protein
MRKGDERAKLMAPPGGAEEVAMAGANKMQVRRGGGDLKVSTGLRVSKNRMRVCRYGGIICINLDQI